MDETALLDLALEEACKARYLAPPNPWVGCVLARDGRVVGRGHTQPPGHAHAEVMAIRDAGELARGATAYVTLEPCSHHGRTGPCTEALIKAGVRRVVASQLDPDPRVSGEGFAVLRDAGIEVRKITHQATVDDLRSYLHQRKTGRPFVVLKAACSIDGRVAASDGTSQWITCEEARRDVHLLRDQSQAIVVGSGTVLADNPSLTIRHVPQRSARNPLRVALDRRGRLSREGNLFDERHGETLVHEGDLPSLLDDLGRRGILQVMVEGGSSVHTAFLSEGLVDQIVLYIGPKILGSRGVPLFDLPFESLSEAYSLTLTESSHLGNTMKLSYLL